MCTHNLHGIFIDVAKSESVRPAYVIFIVSSNLKKAGQSGLCNMRSNRYGLTLVFTTSMDAMVMPTNDTDYKCHITYLTNHMGYISHHIMPLIINSLRADTHVQMFAQKQF